MLCSQLNNILPVSLIIFESALIIIHLFLQLIMLYKRKLTTLGMNILFALIVLSYLALFITLLIHTLNIENLNSLSSEALYQK